MRDFGIRPDLEFSASALDRAAYWLNLRTHGQVWLLIGGASVALTILDFASKSSRIDVDILYILPISVACWVFRLRKSIDATIAITLVSFLHCASQTSELSPSATLINCLVRAMAFAFLAVIVIGCRQMFDYTQSLATHDSLTGALNKGTLNDRMKLLLEVARIGGSPLLLIMLDLDGFKSVNDRHGHEVGDLVLRIFAEKVQRELRHNDCFGRIGGDEFAVGMLVASDDEARALAASLHGRFTSVLAASGHSVTCSMGALIVPAADRRSYPELMRLADQIMYSVKHDGKNAVRITAIVPDAEPADHRRGPLEAW